MPGYPVLHAAIVPRPHPACHLNGEPAARVHPARARGHRPDQHYPGPALVSRGVSAERGPWIDLHGHAGRCFLDEDWIAPGGGPLRGLRELPLRGDRRTPRQDGNPGTPAARPPDRAAAPARSDAVASISAVTPAAAVARTAPVTDAHPARIPSDARPEGQAAGRGPQAPAAPLGCVQSRSLNSVDSRTFMHHRAWGEHVHRSGAHHGLRGSAWEVLHALRTDRCSSSLKPQR